MLITIGTLMAGRYYSLGGWLWGLENISYPRDMIRLLVMSNSQDPMFRDILSGRLATLGGYNSKELIFYDDITPSYNAFRERGTANSEHAEVIAEMYNRLIDKVTTDYVLFLEDDIIAPSNAVTGLISCYKLDDDVGYAAGTVMCRHNGGLFMWDFGKRSVFSPVDSSKEVQYYGSVLKAPYGVRTIGCGHFGLTMIRKSVAEKIERPIFKPRHTDPAAGSLIGCDIVYCYDLEKLGYKRYANFDVRGLHMTSDGGVR